MKQEVRGISVLHMLWDGLCSPSGFPFRMQQAAEAANFTPSAAANAWHARLSVATCEELLADQLSHAHKNTSICANISYDSLLFEQAKSE